MNEYLSILFISITTIPIVLNYWIGKKFKKKLKLLREEEKFFYHQLLSVTMTNFNCRPHIISGEECNANCSLVYIKTLQKFISSAKSSICLCMFMFTLKSIYSELILAHKRGVTVRVIADNTMFKTKPEKDNFSRLTQNGIPYKLQTSQCSMMHHKFCLIDKDDNECAKMFSGSLNLTIQGFCNNFENIVITNNIHIIKRFNEEFEDLWNLF